MNEKTRMQIEAMKKQTVGVEIEMNNITREKAAKKAAEFFGTGKRKMRDGHSGPYLRRHRAAPAADPGSPQSRGTQFGRPRLWSPYPHWRGGAHPEDHPQPGQHHGSP